MTQATEGGWSGFNFDLTPEDLNVFKEATSQLIGVDYTPIAVAKQVVAGVNYSYIAKAQSVVPNAATRAVTLHIFQPLGHEKPHVTGIVQIKP